MSRILCLVLTLLLLLNSLQCQSPVPPRYNKSYISQDQLIILKTGPVSLQDKVSIQVEPTLISFYNHKTGKTLRFKLSNRKVTDLPNSRMESWSAVRVGYKDSCIISLRYTNLNKAEPESVGILGTTIMVIFTLFYTQKYYT